MKRPLNSLRRNGLRRGAAAVEIAVVTPLMLLFLFGIIEFGWLFHVKQTLLAGSRVGARTATLPGATNEEIEDDLDTVLKEMGFPKEKFGWDAEIVRATPEEPYESVAVTVSYENVSLVGGMFFFLDIGKITSQTVYRSETIEEAAEENP